MPAKGITIISNLQTSVNENGEPAAGEPDEGAVAGDIVTEDVICKET